MSRGAGEQGSRGEETLEATEERLLNGRLDLDTVRMWQRKRQPSDDEALEAVLIWLLVQAICGAYNRRKIAALGELAHTLPEPYQTKIFETLAAVPPTRDALPEKMDLWPDPLVSPQDLVEEYIRKLKIDVLNGWRHDAIAEMERLLYLMRYLEIGEG